METDRLDIMSEKLGTIKELAKEIEIFTHKQTELFEVLSQKFPTIEQFSNALQDGNELFAIVNRLNEFTDVCLSELESAKLSYNLEQEKEAKAKEIRRAICEILLSANDFADEIIIRDKLELLLSKIGYK